ncbi:MULTISPECIES: acyltransferase [unclassified Phenylobacterium]|jgi:peptidoglycan/LPS O-acetylase OafA/YrhL|uniref:acyltransferase family protein n=2 Tax=Phenylobacterium TaxID=20 RepID=UPI0008B50871|nr:MULTISPECIES: acyltransferase [unclassified Phenylobacterium]MBA4793377.1 acyltransferase [Phenylobacterium sp.]MBW0151146.1 acyltransferase [Phenylobacterium sp.]MDZ4321355.1 acyltransferase [Phenylobacterium sp.]OHB27329.1 MAG: acyltransferase [Phenylobacterium sp. RIFCSPHIGHO2_01_FULL_69_31]
MVRRESEAREAGGVFPADLPALTSVRFLLALGVVLFHYQLQWPWDAMSSTGFFDRARLGVDAFFILSGFVLTHAYRDAIAGNRMNYGRFLIARFARIYPAHLAVLAFVLVMVTTASLVGAEFDRNLYNPAGLVTTLLLVHAWLPEVVKAEWNGPSWSLSAEWFAYLAFPVFAWIGLKLRRRPMLLLALTALLFLALDQVYQALFDDIVVHAEASMGILRIIPEFLYGVALYRLGERLLLGRRAAVLFAGAAAILLVALMHLKADDRWIVAAAGPLVLALAMLSKVQAEGVLKARWPRLGGEASYALYLVHMPILIAWKGVWSAAQGRDSGYVLGWWEVAALLALSLLAAIALHLLFEGPARAWIRRRADRLWPAPETRAQMRPGSQPPDI